MLYQTRKYTTIFGNSLLSNSLFYVVFCFQMFFFDRQLKIKNNMPHKYSFELIKRFRGRKTPLCEKKTSFLASYACECFLVRVKRILETLSPSRIL